MPRPYRARHRYEADDIYMREGKVGESLVRAWLTSRSDVLGVDDMRSDAACWSADVDFTTTHEDGSRRGWEVKTDSRMASTGNLFVELVKLHHHRARADALQLGNALRTAADWMLFYANGSGWMVQVEPGDLYRATTRYLETTRAARVVLIPTEDHKTTFGVAVPINLVDGIQRHNVRGLERMLGIKQKD